jgi:ribosomal protein S27E
MDERRKLRVRTMLERFGLRVECLNCGWNGRHFSKEQGRLRDRRCPECESVIVSTYARLRRLDRQASSS